MVDKIFLIEDYDDLNKINNTISQCRDQSVFSLNYSTHIFLTNNKIIHEIGESYLSADDYRIIDDKVINTTLNWHADDLLKKILTFDNINLASSLEMEFIQFFTKIYLSILTTIRIIEKEKPREVYVATHINDFVKRLCDANDIKTIIFEEKENASLILDKINLKFNVFSIPISFHISRNKFLRIKKITETFVNRIFGFQPCFKNKKKCILLLDFNPTQYEILLTQLSKLDKQILLLNQRRPAIWNYKSLQIIKNSKCKILHLHQFEKKLKKKLDDELAIFEKNLSQIWTSDSIFHNIFLMEGVSFWNSIKIPFMEICNSRFKESIRRIILLNHLFQTLDISGILEWAETAQEEKETILVAKKYAIKSILLQHAMYPTPQILEPFGRFLSYFSYPVMSDKQAVWGKIMKQYAILHNYKENNVLLTGSPRHDAFFKYKNNENNEGIILLATSGATGIVAKYSTTLARLNYDKFTVEVIRILKTFTDKKLIVKLAPHQEHVGIANVIDLIKKIDPNIPIIINANLPDLISSCDVLITFNNSTIALESIIMDKPTASIQTEEWLENEEIVKNKAILSISKMSEIEKNLKKLVYDDEFKNQLKADAKLFLTNYLSNCGKASEILSKQLDELN